MESMTTNDYSGWSKSELIRKVKELEKRKKFGIVWEDKSEEVANLCKEKFPILEEDKKREIVAEDGLFNALIEGDNYHSLSVLNYTHGASIDVIYIDPPYNQGNKDFVYNDKYVDSEDAYRHSKWLSFMEKRLKLSKNLLKKDGVIFISISGNEQAQLKLLCDEIFGEENFVECIVWQKKSSPKGVPPKNMIVNVHEYILVYQRSNKFSFIGCPRSEEGFKNSDNDPRGNWRNTNIKSTVKDKSKAFSIKDPETGNVFTDTWAFSEKELNRLIKEKYLIFPKKKDGQVRKKEFYSEFKNPNVPLKSFWNVFDNQKHTSNLKNFFGNAVFLNPKPLELMIFLLKNVTNKNSVVLDFFAGSGTTGLAVLELNKEDGGCRSFILCTNNENNNGNGHKIATDICYPLIKDRILEEENKNSSLKKDLSGLKYFRTGFVDSKPTDKNKYRMVNESTEMLCFKENCFDLVNDHNSFKIFKNKRDKHLGIVYDDSGIAPFKRVVKKLKKTFVAYVFSLDGSSREEEFEDVRDLVELSPIPAGILNIYKRIFR